MDWCKTSNRKNSRGSHPSKSDGGGAGSSDATHAAICSEAWQESHLLPLRRPIAAALLAPGGVILLRDKLILFWMDMSSVDDETIEVDGERETERRRVREREKARARAGPVFNSCAAPI